MTQYKINLYDIADILVGEIINADTIEYTEKDNDFSSVTLTLITNNLETEILENLTAFSKIRLFRNDILIFTGISETSPEVKIDNTNVEVFTLIYEHIGKNFATNAEIKKNYTVPTDEGAMAGNIVVYSQTPASCLETTGGIFSNFQASYGINDVNFELTGSLETFDFSKSITVFEALKQICELESDKKKFFKFGPHLESTAENSFEFFCQIPSRTEIVYSGIKSKTIKPSNVYQNIVNFGSKTAKAYSVVIADGDGITSTVITGNNSILNVQKVRIKRVSFKSVKELSKLNLLALKELKKGEKPEPVIDIDILENDPSIGQFGVGALVKIDWTNERNPSESVNDFFRVYELKINLDQMGIETMKLTLAKNDFDEMSGRGFGVLLRAVKSIDGKINLLSR